MLSNIPMNKTRPKNVEYLVDSTSLGSNDFFAKQMNITREALISIFIFWQKAIKGFLCSNYIDYDALVGENACHIRAFALYNFSLLKKNNTEFFSVLNKIIFELSRIISTAEEIPIEKQDITGSIEEFLKKNNLTFSIPTHFFFQIKYIIDSYLLTLTKESLPMNGLTLREKTSYQPVRNWGFSYNKAQYLVHNTQKCLSANSCDYIISEARFLKNKGLSLLLTVKKDSHGRSFIPQFFTGKVLFRRALQKNDHLIFKITRYLKLKPIDYIVFQFKPNSKKNDFELCYDILTDAPIVMIEGVVNYDSLHESLEEYKNRLLSKSIIEVILSNFAAHPQYSGDLKHLPPPFEDAISMLQENSEFSSNLIEKIRVEEKHFIYHQNYAQKEGCSLDKPNLLFINHMYCDIASKYAYYFENNKQRREPFVVKHTEHLIQRHDVTSL